MNGAPHPALRRLYSLGGAPGQALFALASGPPALHALSRELDALPLVSAAAVAALAEWLDASPLDAALGARPLPRRGPEPSGLPGGARRRAGEGPIPVPDLPRPLAASPDSGPELREGTLRTAAAAPAPVGRVESLLAPHAPEAGGQDASGGTPQPRAGGGASGEVREGAAVPERDAGRRRARPRPRTDPEPRLRAIARSVEAAAAALARRAARAGNPEAATTPVGATPAPGAVDALLGAGPGRETPPGRLGRLAAAVARLEGRLSRAAGASAPPALTLSAGASAPPASRWSPGPAAEPGCESSRQSLGGLRGLLRLAAPPEAEDATPARRPAPPREALPDLLAERLEDALLAERLAAVLRREAICQGIDLERVD